MQRRKMVNEVPKVWASIQGEQGEMGGVETQLGQRYNKKPSRSRILIPFWQKKRA